MGNKSLKCCRVVRGGFVVLFCLLSGSAGAQTVTEFSAGISAGAAPGGIAAGPDGNLWFTEGTGNRIGRITTAGVVTEFSAGITANAGLKGIVAGPDGNLWFTEATANQIGRITTAGVVTEFSGAITAGAAPSNITVASDGTVWFTESNAGVGTGIGTIIITGTFFVGEQITGLNSDAVPDGIASGADGNIWFTEAGGNRIARIMTDGGALTEFSAGISAGSTPDAITAGPDGNLWFTESSGNRIGRITLLGVVTEFSAGISANAGLRGITAGPDGNLWFVEANANKIGRITTSGVVTEFSAGIAAGAAPIGIATGGDNNLWFTETSGNRIGRITHGAAVLPPKIAKAFGAIGVTLHTSTTLSVTIGNPNASAALTGIAFTDTLPAGLVVSTPNGLTGSCGSGTITATAGSGGVSLSGGSLAASAMCAFELSVTPTANARSYNNATSTVTSIEGGAGGVATATLFLFTSTTTTSASSQILPGSTPSLYIWSNSFIGPQIVRVGNQTGCVLTVAQPVPNCTLDGGTGTPVDPFFYTCTGPPLLTGCTGGSLFAIAPGAQDIDTHVQLVEPFAPPTIAKSFGAASIPVDGSTSLSFTITNPNAASSLTGVGVSDTLPTGLIVSTPNGLTGTCGGGTITAAAGSGSVALSGATLASSAPCTFSVNVTGSTSGTKNNVTDAVTAVESGSGLTASASITVTTANDANLSALTVSSGSLFPVFAPGTLSYTDTVTNCVASITVTPTLEDPAASVKVNGATVVSGTHSSPISLSVGGNTINVVVTARDGTTMQTYALAVTRAAPAADAPILQSAVSRRVHGAAGTFDLPLSLVSTTPTTEPRKGPAQTISLTFDRAINGAEASIGEGSATAALPTFSGNNVLVNLTGVSDRQYVTLGLDSVASTDGGTGGCGVVRLGFLLGDVNQNRVVTVSDIVLVNAQIAHVVTSANFLKDVNANGILTVSDKLLTNNNVTKALPAP